MTLSYFAYPKEGELLYSAVARYVRDMRITPAIANMLLNGTKSNFGFQVSGNLQKISEVIGKFTPKQLLENHTLFKYYQPFLKKEKCPKLQ